MTKHSMTKEIRMTNDEEVGDCSVVSRPRHLTDRRPPEFDGQGNLRSQRWAGRETSPQRRREASAQRPCCKLFGFRASSFLRHWVFRHSSFILLFVISCSACSAQDSADYRIWTTKSGRKSDVKLAIVESSGEIVKVKRQDNGKVIELRVDQLSDADQRYLRSLTLRVEHSDHSAQRAKLQGSDWTRFRGPGGSCVSADKNIPVEWSTTRNLAWKLRLPGPGSSSPVTWRDRVYVTCYTGYGIDADAPGDMENLERHLFCIRRTDGELLWKATMRSKSPVHAYGGRLLEHGYATHTPTVDQDGVYVFYGSSGAASYTHAGELRWQTSCGETVSGYGSASSPILFQHVLIVSAHVESKSIIGLDTRNGRELWRVEAAQQIWCTPIIARRGDKSELVFFQETKFLAGLNPATGRKLWRFETSPYEVQRVETSPVKYEDAIIMLQGTLGSNSIRLGGTGNVTDSHCQWNARDIHGIPLIYKDQLIATFRGGVRICDAKTAKSIALFRLSPSKDGYASAVIADDKLYRVYQEDGVCVVQLGQEPKQIAHNVLEGDASFFNATPAISNGQLFLRSDKFLYCIQKK